MITYIGMRQDEKTKKEIKIKKITKKERDMREKIKQRQIYQKKKKTENKS